MDPRKTFLANQMTNIYLMSFMYTYVFKNHILHRISDTLNSNFCSTCHCYRNSFYLLFTWTHYLYFHPSCLGYCAFWICVMLLLEMLYLVTNIIFCLWPQLCKPTCNMACLEWSLSGMILVIPNTCNWEVHTQ